MLLWMPALINPFPVNMESLNHLRFLIIPMAYQETHLHFMLITVSLTPSINTPEFSDNFMILIILTISCLND